MIVKHKKNKVKRIPPPDKVSYHRKPDNLSLEAWQKILRKQFVTDKYFRITRLGGHPVFADYDVFNPATKNTYKVALRDNREGRTDSLNYCSCMDFKTNRLGTCKHLEAVLLQVRSNPRMAYMLNQGYHPSYTSVYLHYGEQRNVKIRIGADDRDAFRELAVQYFDQDTLRQDAYQRFEFFLAEAHAINEEFRCYDDALEYVLTVREQRRRATIISERYPTGLELKKLLNTTLFPYQQHGVLFAVKAGRCLIADEMGLGKTIQALGAAELMKREQNIRNILVICPTTLKYQWQSEIHKFASSTVKVIEGAPHIRTKFYTGEEQYKIVSYHTACRDIEAINDAEYDLVILDEAQRIKNWKTKLAQATKKIKSPYSFVLTGTPLENKLEDLYSIMQIIDPYKLGPYYRFLHHHQITDETGKVVGYQHLHEVGDKISDIVVRRLKHEVMAQLPERMDKVLFVPMTEKQLDRYIEYAEMVNKLVYKWRRFGFLSEPDRQKLMIGLNCMRMLCDSTYILDQDYENRHDTKIEELMNILDELFENSGEKVVIFSQWMRMNHLVAKELDARGVPFEFLHGSIPSEKRKDLFDRFNNDPDCRVFLSTDAGSTGLNLQSASIIINLDLPWNPAVLEQRIARVHRIGQQNKVSVINFVANNTIEHRMLMVLDFKSALSQGILDGGEDVIFMDTDSFSKFMEAVEAITVDIQVDTVVTTDEKQESLEMGLMPMLALEVTVSPDEAIPLPIEDTDLEGAQLEAKSLEGEQAADIPMGESLEDDEITDEEDTDSYEGDDDFAPVEPVTQSPSVTPAAVQPTTQPDVQDLLTGGIRFLSGLAQTLSSPEATQRLVSSLVERDKTTGRSFVKIPVDDQQTVTNVMNLLGQLFKGFGK